MFLKQKKGNLVAQFVVLIVIAVVLIFVVSSFGSKIWQAFFPSADKSTMKSFDAVFNLFNSKSISVKDYDATTTNIYLKTGYRVIFFDQPTAQCDYFRTAVTPGSPSAMIPVSETGTSTYYAPKNCNVGKQCLCLYKKEPSTDEKDKNNNVVKCYPFEQHINIDKNFFDLNKLACDNKGGYGSYMFIKRQVYPENKGYVYVILSNDTNKELDANWSIPVCKATDSSNPCYGKRSGDSVEATDKDMFDKIYKYCKSKDSVTYKSTSIICDYPQGGSDCDVNCRVGDMTAQCNSVYAICEDYNQIRGNLDSTTSVKYISANEEYKYYGMCNNDASYCNTGANTNGCRISTWDVYACKNSATGGIDGGTETINADCSPPWNTISGLEGTDCKAEFLKDIYGDEVTTGLLTYYLTYYDEANDKCKQYMTNHFYERQSIMTCKEDKADECQKFIKQKKRIWPLSGYSCDLKFITSGQEYWLTHHDTTDSDCDAKVKELFTTVSFCGTPATPTTP